MAAPNVLPRDVSGKLKSEAHSNLERMNLTAIQSALREQGLDAWLFADFRHSDAIAYRVLGLEGSGLCTRRWYYLVPATGEPVKLNHAIEPGKLDALPGRKII